MFIFSVTLFLLDSHVSYFSSIKSHLATVLYPIQKTASIPKEIVIWVEDFLDSRESLRIRNQELEIENLLNNVRLQKLDALEKENHRLNELLGSSFRLTEQVVVAELLKIDSDPFSQQIVINRGQADDVSAGQPVLDAAGVMGQVMSASRFASRVILLTDPSHSIPVQINRNGLRSIATGRGFSKPLDLEYLPHNADVRVGDLLVTSGLGGRFPAGYPVGTISHIDHPLGKPFAEISVSPAAHLSTSQKVLLVKTIKPELRNNGEKKALVKDKGTEHIERPKNSEYSTEDRRIEFEGNE